MSDNLKINCLDIDVESGDIVLGTKSEDAGSFVIVVSEKDYKNRTVLPLSGDEEVKAIQVSSNSGLELNFFYDVYSINNSFVDLPFSIDVSNFTESDTNQFDITKLMLIGQTAAQTDTDVYIPNLNEVVSPTAMDNSMVKLEIWANATNGISSARLDTLAGYFVGSEIGTASAHSLPVFSWENNPVQEVPRLLTVDEDNNISSYLLTTGNMPLRASVDHITLEQVISADKNPLAASEEISIVGSLYDQYFYVSNDTSCIKVNTDTLNIVEYFENEFGAKVTYKSPDGRLWGLADVSGEIYEVVQDALSSSSSSSSGTS